MKTYNDLLDNGWKMRDIDEMDFIGFLSVRAWKANLEKKKRETTIDKVWPGLSPNV